MAGDYDRGILDVAEEYKDYARFRWLVADSENGPFSPIEDSYSSEMLVTEDLAGKWVRVSVRIDKGVTIYSSPVEISDSTSSVERTLTVSFPAGDVEISADGIDIGFANLTGLLKQRCSPIPRSS